MNDKVKIPAKVAEAIETVWKKMHGRGVVKHLAMTNWYAMKEHYGLDKERDILCDYAEANPMIYMAALVHGYEIEPDWTDQERHALDYVRSVAFKGRDNVERLRGYASALRHFDVNNTNPRFYQEFLNILESITV